MHSTSPKLTRKYESKAPHWRDKMRTLGYFDGYLGFLSQQGQSPNPAARVVDVGAGSGAFAEAWVAINGTPKELTLLDPSPAMLERATLALEQRGIHPKTVVAPLGAEIRPADEVLAAHVIEHCPDPADALEHLRELVAPGGRLRLVVSKPHWCNAIIWLQWRHRAFSDETMHSLLSAAGFAIESTYAFPSGPPSRTSRGYVARPV